VPSLGDASACVYQLGSSRDRRSSVAQQDEDEHASSASAWRQLSAQAPTHFSCRVYSELGSTPLRLVGPSKGSADRARLRLGALAAICGCSKMGSGLNARVGAEGADERLRSGGGGAWSRPFEERRRSRLADGPPGGADVAGVDDEGPASLPLPELDRRRPSAFCESRVSRLTRRRARSPSRVSETVPPEPVRIASEGPGVADSVRRRCSSSGAAGRALPAPAAVQTVDRVGVERARSHSCGRSPGDVRSGDGEV